MYLLGLIALILVGCGTEPTSTPEDNPQVDITIRVHPDFQEHYNKFQELFGLDPNSISINYGETNPGASATCRLHEKRIVVNENLWHDYYNAVKENIVFHELGHCLLGLKHDNSTMISEEYGEIPSSIMSPTILSPSWYKWHKEEYVNNFKSFL